MEHISNKKLDELRDSNPHAKIMVEQRMNQLFMKMFTLFGYADSKRASYYTEYFCEKEYLLTSIEEAIEKAVESFSKAPSIKDIVDLMSGTKRVEKEVSQEWRIDYEKEEELFDKLKARYLEKFGQAELNELVKNWVIEQHDADHYSWLSKFHPELLKSLEKPSLFDFAERMRSK